MRQTRRQPPTFLEALARWHLERWRARRDVYRTDLAYRTDPTPESIARWIRASDRLRRLELNRPWIAH